MGHVVQLHQIFLTMMMKVSPIADVTEATKTIYGMIRDITIKYRKSDKKPMAFFVLEDRTGEMEVCVFTKQYERLKDRLLEGAVVLLDGNVQAEERFSGNADERNDNIVYKFYVENVRPAKKKENAVYLSTSFYRFCLNEADFRWKYEDVNGRPFYIYDTLTGRLRKMTYNVSDKVMERPDIQLLKETF